jgi:hypothetical protein
MLDLHAPALPADQGERLIRKEYKRDFRELRAAIRDRHFWKLERRQHFEETNDPSRDALRRHDWNEAVRLHEEERESLRLGAQENERRQYHFHRLRVIEEPLTPYMRWELYYLRMRAEYGTRIRVLDARRVAESEADGPLPEVVVLGENALYQVIYTESGVPDGAIRHTDTDLVAHWEGYVRYLYEAGEDLRSYYDREVAPLPPPTTGQW